MRPSKSSHTPVEDIGGGCSSAEGSAASVSAVSDAAGRASSARACAANLVHSSAWPATGGSSSSDGAAAARRPRTAVAPSSHGIGPASRPEG